MTWVQFAARHAGGAVGRLAVLRPRLGLARQSAPEHVHADRARRRRGVRVQRGGDGCPASCSRPRSGRMAARSPCTSRRRRSSSCWCCSGRCSNCARAAAPARRSRTCWVSRRRWRAGSSAMAARREVPLEHVHVGDRLRVRPGERVPIDGVVLEGTTTDRRIDGHRRADSGGEGRRGAR